MANHVQAEGFGGGVRFSFLEKPGGHKTFIIYHDVEMCQEIVHKFMLPTILTELLSRNCWLPSVLMMLSIVSGLNDVRLFELALVLLWKYIACRPSHLEQNLSKAGNSITVPHTHENFCSPLQIAIQ